ncbi:MAG TPA: glycosyltransferase family 9 protein [Blastocatellia bacterium]|jgi:lipopolysaccharide heptosyltransferase I
MRILIVKLSSIGDVVHALPAAAWMRGALPGAQIQWVVERRASAILKGSPAIDHLIEIDTRQWRKHFFSSATASEIRRALAQIKGASENNSPPDIAIDFQGLLKSGFVALASGAGRRVGFCSTDLREKMSRIFLTEQAATSEKTHVIEKNLALACAALNVEMDDSNGYEFPIALSSEDEVFADRAISDIGSRFAIINPGGGWKTKLWPADRYAHIADWLQAEFGFSSIVTFGPGEENLADRVATYSKTGAAKPVASTIKQFVALARRAALFVGGDSGPLHLAAAAGAPIVGLYGPTSPERNGPFDVRDITVGLDLWCRPACHRRSCWHWQCMDISTIEVERAIRKRLEDTK